MIPRKASMTWVLCVLALAAAVGAQEICLSMLQDQEPYLMFGTKTAYERVNAGASAFNNVYNVSGCTPVAFWMLNRHGTHNPEAGEVESLASLETLKQTVINNYKNFRNNLRVCEKDISHLREWQWNSKHTAEFANEVTNNGYFATQLLGNVWKSKYPQLFSNIQSDYLFKYTTDRRSAATFKAFRDGVFSNLADFLDLPQVNDEKIVRPYKFCDAWIKNVKENNETLTQKEIFESKEEYKEMIKNVSLRLGFNYDIEPQLLRTIYDMCRYNAAWDVNTISPWCAFFTKEDLKRLEYAEDLETYYKYGYGTDLNKHVGCSYVKEMMEFFKKHVESEQPQKPRVMVTMTETPAILLALGAMGAHADLQPLTGDNYRAAAARARKWSSSLMSPFNANLVAVLHKCTLNGNFKVSEQYQVMFFENEKPLTLENCRVGLCGWSEVTRQLGGVADACTTDLCNGAPKLTHVTTLGLAVLPLIFKFIY